MIILSKPGPVNSSAHTLWCLNRPSRCRWVRQIKSIQFSYVASADLRFLFEDFRLMCNDAIRIAIEQRPKSRFTLIKQAYQRLKEYGLHTHYILSACEVAFAAYRNKDRKADPYFKRAFLKITSQSYQVNHLILRIPTRPREYIYLTLKASDYHLSLIDDPALKRGSITITETDGQPGILERGRRRRASREHRH
jgi:hypothetical protein